MVIWSNPAKADLRAIHDFIAHDSTHYARKVTQDIVARTDGLAELPRWGAWSGSNPWRLSLVLAL